jgi:hypothetical protein
MLLRLSPIPHLSQPAATKSKLISKLMMCRELTALTGEQRFAVPGLLAMKWKCFLPHRVE